MRLFAALLVVVGVGVTWFRTGGTAVKRREAPSESPPSETHRSEPASPRLSGVHLPMPRPPTSEPSPSPSDAELEKATTREPYLDWQELKLLGNPSPSSQWLGWQCVDIDDEQRRSLWTLQDSPVSSGQIHEGTCAEWENRNDAIH